MARSSFVGLNILGRRGAVPLLADRDSVDPVGPTAQIDQAAAFGAEREGGEVGDGVDRVRLRTDWTSPLDHQVVPLDEPFAGEDVAGVVDVEVDAEPDPPESLFDPALVSVEDFSALAAFLYESLR